MSEALPTTERKPGAPVGNKNAVRLSAKVRAAIAHLIINPDATNEQACAAVGCPTRTFYKAKKSPHFEQHFKELTRHGLLTRVVAKAARVYENLLDGDSEYVKADIAKDALAQAGVRERVDGAYRQPSAGSITIIIGGRPGEQVRVTASDDQQSAAIDEKGE